MSASEFAGTGDGSNSSIHLEPSSASELARYRDRFENAPCGYVVLDMDGIVTSKSDIPKSGEASKGTGSWLTLSQSAHCCGSAFYDTQVLPALLLGGTRGEVALDLRVGKERMPVLANFSLEHDAGAASGIRVALFNAKERRLFEKDLLRSRREAEQLAEVILHSSDAIITVETDGIVRNWNKGASICSAIPRSKRSASRF